MTEKEAINVLKMVEAHGCLVIEAKATAIKALEKQIPKKPKKHPADSRLTYCPCCGSYHGAIECYNYCPECGQKLDWND